jgi:hypothetical protein
MKSFKIVLSLAAAFTAFASVSATVVIPPSFEQLVDQAQVIFHGTVTKVSSHWVGEGAERHIVSYVTFKVKESLKGGAGQSFTMRTFGGTVDGETMSIGDGPTFEIGNEDLLFVENNGTQVVPLVGIMHGRFHVRKDSAGRDIVTTNEDRPLNDVAELGQGAISSGDRSGMSLAAFKAAIQNRLQTTRSLQ